MSKVQHGSTHADEQRAAQAGVEYAGSQRRRTIVGILLVVFLLLLIGAAYAVFESNTWKGEPQAKGGAPRGVSWVRSISGWGKGADKSLQAPTDVAIADDSTIWVVSGHNTIAGFNPDGSVKKIIRPKNTSSIEGLTIGDDGHIYVADFGGQVLELDPDSGTMLGQWSVESPQEIDAHGDKIAVSTSTGVTVFAKNGGKAILRIGNQRGSGEDQFDLPHGIAIGDDGTIYVSDTQNRRVKAFSSSGKLLWVLGEAPDRPQSGTGGTSSPGTATASPFMLPSGLTFDGKGRLVVVDPFMFRITIVDPKTGSIDKEKSADGRPGRSATYGEYGPGDGFFAYPTGIDYDKRRDWFAVADTANDRVQIFRLPDTAGSFLAPLVGSFRWPMCVFCIPWLLLLISLMVALARQRGERALTPEEAAEIDAGVIMEAGDTDY